MIWFAICIPLILSGVAFLFWHHKINIIELFLPTLVSLIVIVISYYSLKSTTLSDIEYNGYVIVEARYYEAWDTWVEKTCSYTTTCCCDGKGNNCQTTTHYYDCSYCDYNSEYYVMIDSGGNTISITRDKYLALQKKWNAIPVFVELNRNIETNGSCGNDGDMYSIKWDRKILTSETSTFTRDFTNILKCNHSAFNYPVITDEQASKIGLFNYPQIEKYETQTSVLGIDKLNIKEKREFIIYMDYLNGCLGIKHKVRVFTLFFINKEIDIAFKQEAYWDGGNRNEIVVCVGTDKIGDISWVKTFSWCDNKKVVIDIREDIMEYGKISKEMFFVSYKKSIEANYHFKNFEDFNYLSFEPTERQLIFVYVLITLISIGCLWWCINNKH